MMLRCKRRGKRDADGCYCTQPVKGEDFEGFELDTKKIGGE